MIPTGNWSCESKPKKFRVYPKPLPEQRYGSVYDVKIGPVNLSESNGRLDSRYWLVHQLADKVVIRGAVDSDSWGQPQELFTEALTITALSLSFDNLGRPVVFYQKTGGVFLWFYDSQIGAVTIKSIATNGITPLIDFDIKEDTSSSEADIMLYYVVNDTIYYRLQRDRFDIEYNTGVTEPNLKLRQVGSTEDNRFQIVYVFDDMRDGSLLFSKVLETQQTLLQNMYLNEFELSFTVARAPKVCELITNDQLFFCVAQHSGYFFDADSNQERLFSLEILMPYKNSGDYTQFLILRGGPARDDYYHTMELTESFGNGDYVLSFTQAADGLGGVKQKRVMLTKNTVTVFDVTVPDVNSMVIASPTGANRLRLGAEFRADAYTNFFPAVYTDIQAKVNGVATTWDKQYSDQSVPSVPAGNTMTLIKLG